MDSGNLICSGASSMVAKNHEGATSCEDGEDVREAAGISVTKQPAGKYVVGSLARLFSGTSVTLPTEDPGRAVTVVEGETVIRPKKYKKDVSDNTTQSKESEVEPETAARRRDRIQQRENKKRARESLMSLEEKKRTIFVGNAPLTMNEKSCKKLFSQYGKIESVRMRCIFPSKETVAKRIAHLSKSFHKKQTSVIFYVKFKDEESVQKALAYNGTILDRHRIRVDTCTSKAQYDRKLTVFVGNIPLDAREDDLATLFEDTFGDVSFVRCV
ncbi:hypothetical protein KIN20_024452 [Parelaphostrongylus tenuis]|uniref:RRM domain-containing protein n=1 Tax=Parelaphostrongylus tenuis TaxID=148309 RepID=A0AAD5N9Z7_PARTN|nr:hypothetical protein KIN20_024452 [Parelaphostrongylus tenuis]